MRTFSQLSKEEQSKAEVQALNEVLRHVTEGAIRFNDALNHDDLQARIDSAWEKAESMQTPWFANEYIMDTCGDDPRSMAQADAEDALYPDPSENIIRL